jgi:metallophosphoesterase (TIGR00282 family)
MSGVRLLFVGDVVGKPGRKALHQRLEPLIDEHRIDYVIVNVENAAGGIGLTPAVFQDFESLPIDCFTSGNHIWDKKEGLPLLEDERLLRPANYPEGNPGHGVHVGETAAGVPVATINLEGLVFMKNLDSPFKVADRLLAELPDDVRIVLVDVHAEATSEKQALGFYLDGRVSAVFGTHTHVPTADERILPQGTAYISDVGMTGPYESIIGFRVDKALRRFALQRNLPGEVAKRDVRVAAAMVEADPESGRALAVERWLLPAG